MTKNITTLITGAGAVENAWEPIIRLLSKCEDTGASFDEKLANSYFAQLIYRLRFHFPDKSKSDREKNNYESILNQYELVKVAISDYLNVAQRNSELKIRSQFSTLLDRFVLESQKQLKVINMNWDTVVDNALNVHYNSKVDVIHLHGDIYNGKLYFPSEIVREKYREEEDIEEFGELHRRTITSIEGSKRIILYGVSLDPLDAELLTTIWAGINENLKDVVIVSLDGDLKSIANRVKLVLSKKSNIEVLAFSPNDLSKPFDCY